MRRPEQYNRDQNSFFGQTAGVEHDGQFQFVLRRGAGRAIKTAFKMLSSGFTPESAAKAFVIHSSENYSGGGNSGNENSFFGYSAGNNNNASFNYFFGAEAGLTTRLATAIRFSEVRQEREYDRQFQSSLGVPQAK